MWYSSVLGENFLAYDFPYEGKWEHVSKAMWGHAKKIYLFFFFFYQAYGGMPCDLGMGKDQENSR